MNVSILRRGFIFASLTLALGASLIGPASADEDLLKQIQHNGSIKVGLEGTYPPFSFVDESGKLSGFEVEFADLLAKELGVSAKFQPTKWDGILAALESKRLDVVINQVTISEERKKKYDFSEPYTVSGIQALTRKGEEGKYAKPADLAGVKVGVGLGTNYEQWLKQNVPQADVRTYEDDPSKFQDLRSGRIDVILVDRLAAFDMVNKTNGAMALTGAPFARQEAGIALRKGNPELLAALNKAIDKLRADGTLKTLSEKWFKADVTQ
ncbi:cystine ABC transporter substrate-binding protein [Pseudomonas panipatensis]|jgi:cystine transport system substrate-binding protein|uniref:Cystine transport system substrate-binding protein n=1 Tax=Pseudomonas panipatensis TaxID=428992 RepID=A0A1G8BWK7_9PSED|nr:cystine ABC transporter substrate-binding protein [Pseudomonas panipatensis]SDH37607.1 cystine transport system substrate-binding protein [Pseudomonas panipatensis]SMP66947.1 L-cystine-binding protein /Diaminopimelate-binding protein [Pseudomonas panipatensis]